MTRVLVVEDEPQLVRALEINLKARKYEVDSAPDGATALQLAAARHPDVVLLDLGLPDMDGVDVIKGLRGWTRVPIVVVSARQTSDEKVEALDAGADDYVTKPFSMDELLAEWHLLEVLIRSRGRLVGQKELLQEVWGPSYGTQANYLRVYMAQLRRKLEADPSHPRYLITAPGMGYRFET